MHVRNANVRHARTSASRAPQRNARHVRKLGAQTQRKASSQDGCPNKKLIRNENIHTREHLAKRQLGGWIRTNFVLEVDFLIQLHQGWLPQRNARHVHKLGAPMQRKAHPQVGRPNARPQRKCKARLHVRKLGTPTQCKPRPQVGCPNERPQRKRKARPHVRNLGAPMQCKARPQDGLPNAKLIRNENIHTREH